MPAGPTWEVLVSLIAFTSAAKNAFQVGAHMLVSADTASTDYIARCALPSHIRWSYMSSIRTIVTQQCM